MLNFLGGAKPTSQNPVAAGNQAQAAQPAFG
jgi:hypothetical protein